MENRGINHTKKMAQLYYQDKIWELANSEITIEEITNIINRRYISRSKFKGMTLSKSTIQKIIKKGKSNGTI